MNYLGKFSLPLQKYVNLSETGIIKMEVCLEQHISELVCQGQNIKKNVTMAFHNEKQQLYLETDV